MSLTVKIYTLSAELHTDALQALECMAGIATIKINVTIHVRMYVCMRFFTLCTSL